MLRCLSMALALFLAGAGSALSQNLSLPGCEPSPAVAKALEVSKRPAPGQPRRAWAAARMTQLQQLAAKYPREFEPQRQILQLARWDLENQLPGLREQWVKEAAARPKDPLALTLAGLALYQRDTDAAIKNLKAAQELSPRFPWPALQLADIYSSGRRMDKPEAGRQLTAFFGACPASVDDRAHWLLPKVGNPALSQKVAAALRADLAKTSDPRRLARFATLWALEFRSRPVTEHASLREQVAKDVKRLEAANAKPDSEWVVMLREGSKQAGASKEVQAAFDDRILKAFPGSTQAQSVARRRWRDANPEPTDHTDLEAWQDYKKRLSAFYEQQAKQRPGDTDARSSYIYQRLQDDGLAAIEGGKLIEELLGIEETNWPGEWSNPYSAADSLLSHGWQPARALELAQSALTRYEKDRAKSAENDNLSDADLAERKKYEPYQYAMVQSALLRAAIAAGKSEAATSLAASVEGPPPEEKNQVSSYWANRARLARLQKRNADALTYYQSALHARTSAPKPYQGKVRDELGDEAQGFWKEMGGTGAAWAVWSAKPAAAGAAAMLEDGSWEEPKKPIPDFSLSDLTGQTWTLKGLNGKVLLINLWATWCGPCMNELPHLQKLYEKTKDRSDIQVLTFNMDDELGLVAPFMKEKAYTFPVLPAYDLVMGMTDSGFGIPQNWLVDATGTWRATQLGFNPSATDWEDEMLKKLEGLKTK